MTYIYQLWAIMHQNSFFRTPFGPGTFPATMYSVPVTYMCTKVDRVRPNSTKVSMDVGTGTFYPWRVPCNSSTDTLRTCTVGSGTLTKRGPVPVLLNMRYLGSVPFLLSQFHTTCIGYRTCSCYYSDGSRYEEVLDMYRTL